MRNKYSQKWNCTASFLIPTFMYLWSIFIYSRIHEYGNWERGRAVSFLGIHHSDLLLSVVRWKEERNGSGRGARNQALGKGVVGQTAGGRVAHSLTPLVYVHYNNNLDEGRLMSHIDFRTSFHIILFWICRYLILNFPETMDAQDVQVLWITKCKWHFKRLIILTEATGEEKNYIKNYDGCWSDIRMVKLQFFSK
jgi:hypothetical protein